MKYLFPNFLTDCNVFFQSQWYWIHLCREVLYENRQENNWVIGAEPPQIPFSALPEFGSYELVGGFNFEKIKGIRITQHIPTEDYDFEMSAYIADYYPFSDTVPTIYLVFNCTLTEKSSDTFRKLFSKWIQPDVNREEIDGFIDSLNL